MFMMGAERRFAEIEKLAGEITAISRELRVGQTAGANASLDRQQTVLIGVMAVAVLVGCLVSLLVSSGITRPVVSIAEAINQIAQGNLGVAVPNTGQRDEIGTITNAAIALQQGMQDTVRAVADVSREVANAAMEISGSTADLSQRTEEQAASLEETAASMEEITSTVRTNAENAQQASKLAADSCTVADRSGAIVAQTVQAMARIEHSSTKIADIIGVIDEIARQTNLLALNAAVEAARAGEAGRGFAVVAVEVRSLSQRSAQAAKDIKDLIVKSSTQVKEGVDLVNRAGKSLHEIIGSIKQVATIVVEIASASVTQAAGLDQVNKALSQMDEITQHNSALVEQNAATARMLEERAHAMNERLGFFQLDEEAAPRPAAGNTKLRAAA
jgi:methyl-accepting chemotaxis protein